MANLTPEDGATKPAASSAEVSVEPRVPCLIPSFADAVKLLGSRYSCLVLDTHRRHIALPPVHMRKKRTGIQEELKTELLRYSTSLRGVPLAFDNIKIVGQHGDICDDQGFIHINIEASFVIFKPRKGSKLVGVINKIGVGHVGCLVHGCFNACVVKPTQLTPEQWRDSGLQVGQAVEFEVFKLDSDFAGVLLISGRLEKSRVQELVAQTEAAADPVPEPEDTEDLSDVPKPKKRKKDKTEKQSAAEDTVDDSSLSQTCGEHDPDPDALLVDSNSNGQHKKKKKKKDKRRDCEEVLPSDVPASDSSGYMSDRTSRKRRAAEMEELSETPASKKTKKSK